MKKFFFHTLLITLLVSCGDGGEPPPPPPPPPVNNESTNIPPPPSGKEIFVQLTPNKAWNDFNASVKIFNLNTLAIASCKENTDSILEFICLVPNIDIPFLAIGELNNKIYLGLFSPVKTTEVELNEETTNEVLKENIVQIQNGTVQVNTEKIKNLTDNENKLILNILCD